MKITIILSLFVTLALSYLSCEQTKFFPIGDILSTASDIANVVKDTTQTSEKIVTESTPKINLKIVPSKKLHITKDDMNFLLAELRQEIRRQMNMLEDELDEKERLRQKSSSIWSISESPIYVPNDEDTMETEEAEVLDIEDQEEVKDLLNSLNEISTDNSSNIKENRTYHIEIKDNKKEESDNLENAMKFRQKAFRNGPLA